MYIGILRGMHVDDCNYCWPAAVLRDHIPPYILLIVELNIVYVPRPTFPTATCESKIQAFGLNRDTTKSCLGRSSSRNVPIVIFKRRHVRLLRRRKL